MGDAFANINTWLRMWPTEMVSQLPRVKPYLKTTDQECTLTYPSGK